MSQFDEPTEWRDETAWPLEGASLVSAALMVALPLSVASFSLVVGLLVGAAGGWMAGHAFVDAPTLIAAIDPNDIRFGEVCAPVAAEAQTRLQEINAQIGSLKKEIRQREARVLELETEMARRSSGRSVSGELKRAREELAQVRQERDLLVAVKEQLVDELGRTQQRVALTEQALEDQVELTERIRDRALTSDFGRFLNEAQLDICERGTRKKLGRCREVVTSLLDRGVIRQRFDHCVRSGQAMPRVNELGKADALPEFSFLLDEDDKVVRGWYLHLCDPTLPENDALLASATSF